MRKPPLSHGCLVLGFSKHFFAFYTVGPLNCLLDLLPEVETGTLTSECWESEYRTVVPITPLPPACTYRQAGTARREDEGGGSGLIPVPQERMVGSPGSQKCAMEQEAGHRLEGGLALSISLLVSMCSAASN